MTDQLLEAYRWIAAQPVDWRAVFVGAHYAGLALALATALLGDGLGIRVLLTPGPKPSRRMIHRIHAGVILGLLLVWGSGLGMLLQKFALDQIPNKLVFKLAVATILSLNALMVRALLMPLAQRVRRPLAPRLSLGEAFGVALVGSVSLSGWLALAAIGFAKPLQALPLTILFIGYAAAIGGLAVICLVLIGVLGAIAAPPREGAPRRRKARPTEMPLAGGPLPVGRAHTTVAPHLLVSNEQSAHDRLTQRLRQSLAAQRSNDNSEGHVRERLERERVRRSRPFDFGAKNNPGEPPGPPRSPSPESAHRQRHRGRASNGDGPPVAGGETRHLTLSDVRARCREALFGAAGVSFVSNLLMLSGPLFMLQIYDRVLTSKSLPTLTALFALVIALFVFMGVLDVIRSRLLVRIGLRIDRLLGAQVFDHSIAVAAPGDVRERAQLQKDLTHVRQFVSGAGTVAIFDMPWVPVYFAIVAMFHWSLGLVALAGAGVLVVLSLLNEFLSRKPVMAAANHAAEADRLFEAGRQHREVLHAMGMTPRYRDRWVGTHSAELVEQTRAADIAGLLTVSTKTTRLALQSAMLTMGAYLVLGDEITPGVMIASSIIMSRALAPVEIGVAHWRGFISARQGLKRLGDALAATQPVERLTLPRPEGHLRIENLFAGPVGAKDPLLKGLDFELAPGDALGVLGPSGSGKSTLARVLVGVWPVMRGRVTLDGAPLAHWPLEQLGEHIGYLPQDAVLFDGTVADNIARFDAQADPTAIIAAAQNANVHDLILSLPEGYNTRVGEGGTVLSGGQRQRIALARALYGAPSLIILDEPNSNLDQAGEEALAAAIAAMRRAGRTVIVMAHRRKALEHVSHILVLKAGRQAAFGAKETILGAARQAQSAKRRQYSAAT